MSLRKRLERLEERTRPEPTVGNTYRARPWERFFHAHENGRRELLGLEPLPDLPYTEEDREDDMRCLEEVIPSYRAASPGWRSGEGKAFLTAWEQHIRERLETPVEALPTVEMPDRLSRNARSTEIGNSC